MGQTIDICFCVFIKINKKNNNVQLLPIKKLAAFLSISMTSQPNVPIGVAPHFAN